MYMHRIKIKGSYRKYIRNLTTSPGSCKCKKTPLFVGLHFCQKIVISIISTIIWENPSGFSFGELLLFKDLLFIMQKNSELLCQVQVFTCWVRSDWVKRTRILFHSPHTFFVSGKSASRYLVKEHFSLCFRSLDLIQKKTYATYKAIREWVWCISFHMDSYQAT